MTTALVTSSVTLGYVGETPIVVALEPNIFVSQELRTITLLADYARSQPPGYPVAVPGAPIGESSSAHPKTLPAGASVTFFGAEAAALIAAGAAS